MLQCSHGFVENNRFYRQQGASIYVMLELLHGLWFEGSGVDGLTIRNNIFINCNCANWSSVIDNLQPKLIKLGKNGFRHHTAIGVGHIENILREAFTIYLGYDIMEI